LLAGLIPVGTAWGQWDAGISQVNILLPPVAWAYTSDSLGTAAEAPDQVVNNGVMKLKYVAAPKQGSDWPWLQIQADLPYSLAEVDSVTISYSSDHPIEVLLPQQAFIDDGSFAHYRYTLPAAAQGDTRTIKLDAFGLPDWASADSRKVAFNPAEVHAVAVSPALGEGGAPGTLQVDQIVLNRKSAEARAKEAAAGPTPENPPAETAAETLPAEQAGTQVIYFSTNKTDVAAEYLPILGQVAEQLKAEPNLRLEITGFADSRGDHAYNLSLSEQRAEAVAQHLSGKGVPSDRVEISGRGAAGPAAEQADTKALQRERRVELRLVQE